MLSGITAILRYPTGDISSGPAEADGAGSVRRADTQCNRQLARGPDVVRSGDVNDAEFHGNGIAINKALSANRHGQNNQPLEQRRVVRKTITAESD